MYKLSIYEVQMNLIKLNYTLDQESQHVKDVQEKRKIID